GDEDAETAGQRQEPGDGEALVRLSSLAGKRCGADDDPQERGGRQDESARQIEPQAHAQRGRLDSKRGGAADREDRGPQSGNRREPLERQRLTAQAPREAGRKASPLAAMGRGRRSWERRRRGRAADLEKVEKRLRRKAERGRHDRQRESDRLPAPLRRRLQDDRAVRER